jgi:FtsZ-binding cell division protein ZapB
MEENDREFLIGVIEKLDIFIDESSDEFETNTGENPRQEEEKLKRILEKMDYLEVENEELKNKNKKLVEDNKEIRIQNEDLLLKLSELQDQLKKISIERDNFSNILYKKVFICNLIKILDINFLMFNH